MPHPSHTMALLYAALAARLGKRGQISYCAHFTEQEAEAVGNRGTGGSSPSQEEGKASSVSIPSTKPLWNRADDSEPWDEREPRSAFTWTTGKHPADMKQRLDLAWPTDSKQRSQ